MMRPVSGFRPVPSALSGFAVSVLSGLPIGTGQDGQTGRGRWQSRIAPPAGGSARTPRCARVPYRLNPGSRRSRMPGRSADVGLLAERGRGFGVGVYPTWS